MLDAQSFTNLYQKNSNDEVVTPFVGDIGFSIVRKYPDHTPYHKDGMRMFIKLGLLKRGFFYSVDMTLPQREKGDENITYSIEDGDKYKPKVTNFYSDTDPFEFNEIKNKVIHKPSGKEFTVSAFIEVLAKNHLSDRLYYKRIKNRATEILLKFIFWSDNREFERITIMLDKYHADNKEKLDSETNPDPFFKYFNIKKNILFVIIAVSFILISSSVIFPHWIPLRRWWIFGSFNLSNPYVVLCICLILLICEKFSVWLNSSINYFFSVKTFSNQKINWIEKIFNYSQKNSFNLKL